MEGIEMMMGLEELKENRGLLDAIDWDMSPEEAVRLYLEWGNNWSRGYHMVRSKSDQTNYFVLNTWEDQPVIYLVNRNSDGAVELAKVDPPRHIIEKIEESYGNQKGVYSVDDEVRTWLREALEAD